MTRRVLFVAALAVLAVALWSRTREVSEPPRETTAPIAFPKPTAAKAPAPSKSVEPVSVDASAQDPRELTAASRRREHVRSAQTYVLHGHTVTECRPRAFEKDGVGFPTSSCSSRFESPQNYYLDFSDEHLEDLSYADPAAAVVLGLRLVKKDPKRHRDLMYRGVALTGKPGPALRMANETVGSNSVDGELDAEDRRDRIVDLAIALRLGHQADKPDQAARLAHYVDLYAELLYSESAFTPAQLRATISARWAYLDAVHRQVAGGSFEHGVSPEGEPADAPLHGLRVRP